METCILLHILKRNLTVLMVILGILAVGVVRTKSKYRKIMFGYRLPLSWVATAIHANCHWYPNTQIAQVYDPTDLNLLTLSVREPHLCLYKQVGSQASCRVTRQLAWDPTCLRKHKCGSRTERVNPFPFNAGYLYKIIFTCACELSKLSH